MIARATVVAAALALSSTLLAGAAEARWLPPWACREFREQPGERQRYFEALRTGATGLLDGNLAEEARYGRLYGVQDANGSATLLSPEAVLSDPIARNVATRQLARFKELMELRIRLRSASETRTTVETRLAAAATLLRTSLESTQSPRQKEQEILRVLAGLRDLGFLVVRRKADGGWITVLHDDGSWDRQGRRVTPSNGLYYFDVDRDIRAAVRMNPRSETFKRTRLFQIVSVGLRDSRTVQAMLQHADLMAPILDAQVRSSWLGVRVSRLGELVLQSPSLEDFVTMMQAALVVTRSNIVKEQEHVGSMTAADARMLARSPSVRLQVLTASPDLEGMDCIVEREWSAADVAFTVVSVVGGIAALGAHVLGHPDAALAIGALLTGLGAADAVRQRALFREVEQAYLTGIEGPSLVSREIVLGFQARFYLTAITSVLATAIVVQQCRLLYNAVRGLAAMGRGAALSTDVVTKLSRLGQGDQLQLFLTEGLEAVTPEAQALILGGYRDRVLQFLRTRYPHAAPYQQGGTTSTTWETFLREEGGDLEAGILNADRYRTLAEGLPVAEAGTWNSVEVWLAANGELRYVVNTNAMEPIFDDLVRASHPFVPRDVMLSSPGTLWGAFRIGADGAATDLMHFSAGAPRGPGPYPQLAEVLELLGIPVRATAR